MKQNVSLCCVAFNESNRLDNFIKYHRKWFDDIIVVNQGSTDNTTQKLIDLGVRQIYDDNQGFAEPSRHLAALSAEHDWILFLDADEFITEYTANNLHNFINQEYQGFFLERLNYIDDIFQETEFTQYRLFHKRNVVFKNYLHGGITPKHGTNVGQISNAITHKKTTEEHSFDHETYKELVLKTPEAVSPIWYINYMVDTFPLEQLITMVVTTSAKHTNPSISHIENLIDKYSEMFCLRNCSKIVVADGFWYERNINNKTYNKLGYVSEDKYEEYKNNLKKYCSENNILLLTPKNNLYMHGAQLFGTRHVSTPYYFFTPDDITPVKSVDIKKILHGMSKHVEIKRLNFHNYNLIEDNFNYYLEQVIEPFPCLKTPQWSGNTHIGYTHFNNYVYGPIQDSIGRYPLELEINKRIKESIEKIGKIKSHCLYGTYIYGTYGETRYVDHDFGYLKEMDKMRLRYHSYDFPDGTKVDGALSTELLNTQFEWLGEIDFKDKTVLDIGCWDGFYSIKAKEKGALSVLGIDVNPWASVDWQLNFDEAVQKFNFNPVSINCRYQNLFELDSSEKRDIVLFMGVLYHLQDPLGALHKLREITREKLILETLIDGDDLPFPCLKFYPGKEMGNDPTNWFGPNKLWVESALKVAGFNDIQLIHDCGNRVVYHAS